MPHKVFCHRIDAGLYENSKLYFIFFKSWLESQIGHFQSQTCGPFLFTSNSHQNAPTSFHLLNCIDAIKTILHNDNAIKLINYTLTHHSTIKTNIGLATDTDSHSDTTRPYAANWLYSLLIQSSIIPKLVCHCSCRRQH